MTSYEPKSRAETELRAHGLALPEAYEEFPWGHRALKVNKKAFAFIGWDGGRFSMSAKLPQSNVTALDQPFAEPTGYGLGKSGWVSASFEPGEQVPVDVLKAWLDESYRAIAPKRALKQLGGGASPAKVAPPKRASAAKPVRASAAPKTRVSAATAKRKVAAKRKAPARGKPVRASRAR